MVVAPIVVLVNGLWVKNCDVPEGLAFFGVGPAMSLLFASQIGAACGMVLRRTWAAMLLFVFIWLAWAFRDLLHFYQEPSVFAYNPFAGFFSGAVYDDVIMIDGKLMAFRASNLLLLAAMWQVCALFWEPEGGRMRVRTARSAGIKRWLVLAVAALAWSTMYGLRGHIGYEITRDHLRSELGGMVSNERITLYYASDVITRPEALLLLEDHTFRLGQLDDALADSYPHQIESYVYGSPQQKRRLMGAERVYIAKPWLREIHLNRIGYGNGVIHHELAHVVLGRYAGGLFDIPTDGLLLPHNALIEGAAEAMEWYGGRLTHHQWSAAMRKLDLAPDLASIMGPSGFWSHAARKSYTLSGSFVRWLLDTHGSEPFKRVYRDADFANAYGQPLPELVKQWEAFVDALELPPDALELARRRFDVKGILQRVCPLEIARLRAEAARHEADGLGERALEVHRTIVGYVPDDPHKRIPIVRILAAAGQADRAASEVNEIVEMKATDVVTRALAIELLGDALWRAGRPAEAHETYKKLKTEPQSEDRKRNVLVKIDVSNDSAREPIIGPYLLGKAGPYEEAVAYLVDAIADLPGDPLPMYLLGRRHFNDKRYETARPLLRTVTQLYKDDGRQVGVLIHRETWRLLGQAYYFTERYDEADEAFRIADVLADSEGTRLMLLDWAERARWRSRRSKSP